MADRSGYIGRAPGDSSVIVARKVYEPTGVQTDFTFTAGYTPGYCDAYINGVKLINSTDYTASDGSTVGLTSAAQSGDVVEIVAYKAFNLGMPVSDITGNLDVTGNISASSSITADGGFYGDGSNLSGIPGVGITQYIDANSLTVIGSPGVSTITRLGVTDAVVTGIITANGLSGNVVGAAATFTTGTFNGNVTIGGTLTYEDVTNVDALGIVTARAGVAVTGGQLTVGVAFSVGNAGVATAKGLTVTGTSNLYDDVNFYGAAGDASWDKSNSYLIFPDNTKAVWGSSGTSDLSIYHNSGTTCDRIDSGNKLEIRANASIDLSNEDGSSTYAFFNESGSSDLYYSNSKKWETTNDGAVTTGIATATVGIDAAISVWTLGASGTDHYTFTGPGNLSATSDPTLNLIRGQKYTFKNRSGGHPFRIQSTPNGSAGTAYNTGVTNNDGGDGTNIIFDVPYDAPAVLYYQCTSHGNMGGAMYISGSGYETKIGTGITIGSAGVGTFADGSTTANALHFGTGGDLKLYHDGSDSYVDQSGSGNLYIRGNGSNWIRIQPKTGEEAIRILPDAEVQIYYDNSKKIETTNDGVSITGICTATDFSGASGGAADFPNGITATTITTTQNIDVDADSSVRIGDDQNLQLKYTGSEAQIVQMDNSNPLRIKVRDGAETAALFNPTGSVDLYFDDSAKLYTTNEGVTVSGMMSTSAGLAVTGGMWEGAFYKVGKLSDNQTIGISTSNIFVFATTETTTSTPNIIWNDTYPLSSKMNVGDVVTVTVISVAAAGGYSANWTIDGNAISEQWNGGSAPSAGGSDGFDIYTHTIVRKGTGTGDSGWLMFSNVSNFT